MAATIRELGQTPVWIRCCRACSRDDRSGAFGCRSTLDRSAPGRWTCPHCGAHRFAARQVTMPTGPATRPRRSP